MRRLALARAASIPIARAEVPATDGRDAVHGGAGPPDLVPLAPWSVRAASVTIRSAKLVKREDG
jgi:hypothetical protein